MGRRPVGPGGSLSAKQARFVEEYLLDLNATQAAIRAGYSERTARQQGARLLTNVDIATAIEAGQKERSSRVEASQDYVLRSVIEVMERCKQASPVLDRSGNPVMVETADGELAPAFTFNAMGVLKGAEMIGKHLGMFKDGATAPYEAPPLNITISVREAVGDVRVTQPERPAGDLPQGA